MSSTDHKPSTGVTYLVRHGRTSLSKTYITNGDPSAAVVMDSHGRSSCARAEREWGWLATVASCRVSQFPRTRETAAMLLVGSSVEILPEPRLNELDYGSFEAGPWLEYGRWLTVAGPDAVPPGSRESWRSAARRMLAGLRACLDLPSPRLVVAHGMLLSLVERVASPGHTVLDWPLPEAAYVTPLCLSDDELTAVVERGLSNLTVPSRQQVPPTTPGGHL
ncbi:hypothetical protein GCM10009789_83670 [Kribbella sancticallisti]|uniref:Phosphoglycerate mutase n=1 Tax=Kribbella sancticallisti TaxID=460087 RepID=A0ABN2ET26_9ACTN